MSASQSCKKLPRKSAKTYEKSKKPTNTAVDDMLHLRCRNR